ncbi:MAG TPA: DUF6088 family protein [bacterium]|nr:DUF6088 family protein [bacterium]
MVRRHALDLKAQIQDRIASQRGTVWTPVDFLDLGPRAAVDKALQRLAKDGHLSRIDRGLYFSPAKNSLTGKTTNPDQRAVIAAVARRDQTRIVVDGLTAANDLGLTTAVPTRITVLTDARLRPIRLGNQQIQFKTVAPSRLFWAGRPAMRVVQALYWLQDILRSDRATILQKLTAILNDPAHGPEIRDDLRQGLHTLPIWMQSILRELLAKPDKPSKTAQRHHATERSSASQ